MFAEIGLVFGGQLAKFHYYVCWFMQNFSRVYGLVILGVSIFAPSKTSEFHFCYFSLDIGSDSDSSFGRKTTIMLGKGAGFGAPPKVRRPRMKRISAAFRQNSWNHFVSVLAGRSATTSTPFWASSKDLRTH